MIAKSQQNIIEIVTRPFEVDQDVSVKASVQEVLALLTKFIERVGREFPDVNPNVTIQYWTVWPQ